MAIMSESAAALNLQLRGRYAKLPSEAAEIMMARRDGARVTTSGYLEGLLSMFPNEQFYTGQQNAATFNGTPCDTDSEWAVSHSLYGAMSRLFSAGTTALDADVYFEGKVQMTRVQGEAEDLLRNNADIMYGVANLYQFCREFEFDDVLVVIQEALRDAQRSEVPRQPPELTEVMVEVNEL